MHCLGRNRNEHSRLIRGGGRNEKAVDFYFFSFLDGGPVPFPIAILENALGRYADQREPTYWPLTFPDGGMTDLYVREAPQISHFMLNRPALSLELWRGVFEIMKKTPGILVCTGAGSCVTDASVISRID